MSSKLWTQGTHLPYDVQQRGGQLEVPLGHFQNGKRLWAQLIPWMYCLTEILMLCWNFFFLFIFLNLPQYICWNIPWTVSNKRVHQHYTTNTTILYQIYIYIMYWTVSWTCWTVAEQYPANVLNMLDSIQQMYTASWIASSECIERVQILGIFLDYRHQCTSIAKCTWQSSLRLAICTVLENVRCIGSDARTWTVCKTLDISLTCWLRCVQCAIVQHIP